MNDFNVAFYRTIGNEGNYQCDRQDRGNWTSGVIGRGELKGTKFGLSAMTYPDLDIKNLTMEEARAIYRRDFWEKLDMSQMRRATAYQFFDASINHGVHNATRMLQEAAGAKPDGFIGPKTLAAVKAMDLDDMLMLFLSKRLNFMTDISTFDRYGRGWSRRIAKNLEYAAQDN